MASCKDCLSCKVCYRTQVEGIPECTEVRDCPHFKDRNKFVELPCKVGDTVFVVNGFKEIEELEVDYYVVEKNVISVGMVDDGEYEVETVFLTKSEAEQALKERENNG